MFLKRGKGWRLVKIRAEKQPCVCLCDTAFKRQWNRTLGFPHIHKTWQNKKIKQTTNLHCKTHSPQLPCREVFGFAAPRVDETQCSLDSLFFKVSRAQANSQVKSIYFFTLLQQQSLLILHKVRGMQELLWRKSYHCFKPESRLKQNKTTQHTKNPSRLKDWHIRINSQVLPLLCDQAEV